MKIIQSSCYLTFTANVTKIFLIEHCLESFGVQVIPAQPETQFIVTNALSITGKRK